MTTETTTTLHFGKRRAVASEPAEAPTVEAAPTPTVAIQVSPPVSASPTGKRARQAVDKQDETFADLLDEEDEEASYSRHQPSSISDEEAEVEPINDASDGSHSVSGKARRAAKREQNHLEHPVWYRRRPGREPRDIDYLNFIARFRAVKAVHLAALHGVTKHTAYKRLKALEEYGYVREQKVYDQSSIWLLTPSGAMNTAYPHLEPVAKGKNLGDLNHDLIVAHVAAHWAGGTFDVLNEGEGFTELRVADSRGKHAGELEARRKRSVRMATEFELRSALGVLQSEARKKLANPTPPAIADYQKRELSAGDWNWQAMEQPERFAMFVPPARATATRKTGPFLPDLVLVRSDGTPNGWVRTAVEVELTQKATSKIKDKLNAYRWSEQFDEVIYVCPDKSLAKKLHAVAAEVGLTNMRVIPLYLLDRGGQRVAHTDPFVRF